MEVVFFIFSVIGLIGIIKLLSPIKQAAKGKSSFRLETDISLLKIELWEAEVNVSHIKQRQSKYAVPNYPKRYHKYVKIIDTYPKLIHQLEDELKKAPDSSFMFIPDRENIYINSLLAELKSDRARFQDFIDEMNFHYEGNGTPKNWYEAKENLRQTERKINYLNERIALLKKFKV